MNVVVDSSVWIGWLRAHEDIVESVRPWIQRGELFLNGIIRAEVLRGIIREHQRDRMAEIFDVMNEAPTNSAFWKRVGLLAWNMDRMGVILPLPDLVIAQTALDCDAAIISTDKHYLHIPRLRVLDQLPPI